MSAHEEARNLAPPPGARAFWVYIASVTVAGFVLLAWQLRTIHTSEWSPMSWSLFVIALMVVIGEVRPLVIAGTLDVTGVTTSTTFTFALLLHIGLPIALLMQTGATVAAAFAHRRVVWRTAFNVGQFALSYSAAALVLWLFGRHASLTHPLSVDGAAFAAIGVSALVYFLVNNAFVSMALALRGRTSLRSEFFGDFTFQAFSSAALLGMSPIVVVVIERGTALVPLLLFPLGAVYATAAMTRERERQSSRDPLTGLGNRHLLASEVTDAIVDASQNGTHLALFLLDLDRFKEINDTLGHGVGDQLLQMVGRRLTETMRPTDVIARLGGDEYAVLVRNLDDPQVAIDMAERVRAALLEPFRHDEFAHEIEGSVGIALHPQHASDFETLLQRADIAMYVAKERGVGVQVYSPDIDRHSKMRLGVLAELREALEHRDLELYYQPKADLRTGNVVGVETLLRWQHPERGLLTPDDFLPLAEQTGLMRLLTQFVVDEALRQVSVWWHQGIRIQAAVNVSARDLYDRGFAQTLQASIAAHDVPPRALLIEVTESVVMTDPARAASTLLLLAGLGVGVSLDDFGTGYSSLVHLKRLPVTEVKIDRSFVMRMDVNEDDAAIVRSIIDLASALGLRTVAEGVETREAWDRLAVCGCDVAQGWYLAKAMPAGPVTDWLVDYEHNRTAAERPASVPMRLPVRPSTDRSLPA